MPELRQGKVWRVEQHDAVCVQVIASEGEQKASVALKEAADIIAQSPAALQLRYLQVLG